MISMGADDINFSDVVAACVTNYLGHIAFGTKLVCVPGAPGPVTKKEYFLNLPAVATHFTALIQAIEARGEASPSHIVPKIVVQDYFDPFPSDVVNKRCADVSILDPTQVAYISTLVQGLDNKISGAVKAIARSDKNVGYVELHDAFVGHQWCDDDPEAYGISIRTYDGYWTNQAPFHPTPEGQQTIAAAVAPEVESLLVPSPSK